jgi:uncharacterized repeat protein (TIGR01451 family)
MKLRFFFSVFAALLFSFFSNAQPYVTSITPNYGAYGDPNYIHITGTGFSNTGLIVKFNGVAASGPYANSSTDIQVLVPAGAPKGTGLIYVSVNGQAAPTNNGVTFTVIGPYDPYASSFDPSFGAVGATVTFYGEHFTTGGNITAVKFNGVSASFGPLTYDTTFQATVPAGAQTGPISIEKTGYTTFVSSSNFYVAPTITSFSPTSGRAGTNVVIKGTSFTNSSSVKFGSLNAASFNVDSNSQITAVAPANVLSGNITVTAPGGQWISSGTFAVLPTVSGFTPGFGSVGASIVVTGANFNVGTPSAKFGGVTAATPAGISFSQLTVKVPSGATNAPITVTTSDGSGTSAQIFYVTPSITSFTPTNSAPGTTVKISGNNFSGGTPGTGATAVSFGGVPATSFYVSNNTTIGAIVPSGVITGPISVTTPAGTVYSSGNFYALPVVLSFNPAHGADNARITITGTNFLGATAVLFNGTSASFTVTNNGVIGATVPSGATSGPITVVAPGGTNSSASSFTVDLTSDLNVGVVDSPDPVFVTSNLTYTITVANNGPDAALNVKLTNTLPASVVLKSASSAQFTLNTNANPILGTLASLNNGAIATVTLNVVPQSAGWITNVAMIGSDNIDPSLTDHAATNATLVWPSAILSIQTLTSNQVKVFWPAPLSNFYLLAKTNLIPSTIWSTDLTSRLLTDTNISVTETNSGAVKFFRLKQ